jgi:urease accessory protein
MTALNPGKSHGTGNDWLLWQIVDSAFPTGGFAHSAGLEAAWQHGDVSHRLELVSFIETGLRQVGRATLPFATATHQSPKRLKEIDQLCDTFTTNHVANRASRAQGRAFLLAVDRIFASPELASAQARQNGNGNKHWHSAAPPSSAPPYGHFAPVFGAVTRRLGLERETAVRLFLFQYLRGVLAAAVRLNIVGPMVAQTLQLGLSERAEEVASHYADLSLYDLAQTAPLLDLWQGTHDRLYSRLFQS